ncbi:MAG: hypothetical protein M3214_05255, partial [Actinomycetota bacterium]|nr:hypothetical protein [Actinomycetota bacterium]
GDSEQAQLPHGARESFHLSSFLGDARAAGPQIKRGFGRQRRVCSSQLDHFCANRVNSPGAVRVAD